MKLQPEKKVNKTKTSAGPVFLMENSKEAEAKSYLNGAPFQQEILNKSLVKRLSAFSNSEEFVQR